jgi:molybdopterin-containing oxidoreductase family membrane subunit
MSEERPGAGHETLLSPIERTGRRFYVAVAILLVVIGIGGFAYLRQVFRGLGVTGMNRPIWWGVYITNFVYFIGLSHAGTLISAILRIVGAEWRRPFTRLAEAVTVFSLPFGAGSILLDLGRIDRVFNVVRYARFQSPILWDVTAVSVYMLSSVIFFYVAMIPDIAVLRDRYPEAPAWRRWLYRTLALGWKGTPAEFHRLEKIMGWFAIYLSLLVIMVHTVVSWIFGMTIVPGWHSAIIGPYFLVGAIFCGVAAVAIVAAILRWLLGLQKYITAKHFNYLGQFLVALTLAWFYFTFAEFLTTAYGGEPAHMAVFWAKFRDEFSLAIFAMFFFCFMLPLPILAWRRTRTILGVVVASVSINIGMWLERWTVIVPSLARPRLPYGWGSYTPTWIEWAVTAACFASLILLYVLFTKVFPVVAMWEVDEQAHEPAHAPVAEDAVIA